MNWGELKSAVAAYTHRSDITALMPTFLELAEQRIYYGEANSPKVRCAAMRQSTTLANGTRPVGFLEAIKVAEAGSPEKFLEYRPLERMPQDFRAYTWDGDTLVLSQDQGFPVDLKFYAKLTTPVADGDSNWLLENTPAIYLASMLVEVARWSRDDALGVREASNYASAVNALTSQEKAAAMSGSTLRMKVKQ